MNVEPEYNQPVNIGNPAEFTIKELADLVVELSGVKPRFEYHPLPIDDPTRRQPDITLAKKLLEWEPRIKLRDGLKQTIDWFKSIDIGHYRPPSPNY